MFKKFGLGSKKEASKPEVIAPVNTSLKYEKSFHDIKMQIDKLDDQMERYDLKTSQMDAQIRDLISQGKKQQARGKIAEMKGYQNQIQTLQIKRNTLTQMQIKIESLDTDQSMAEVVIQAAQLGKEAQATNDQLQDAMLDWNEMQQSQEETKQLWQQMSEMGIDQTEVDDEFSRLEQEVNQQKQLKLKEQFNAVPKAIITNVEKPTVQYGKENNLMDKKFKENVSALLE